jgi:hypothetical protein
VESEVLPLAAGAKYWGERVDAKLAVFYGETAEKLGSSISHAFDSSSHEELGLGE